METVQPKLRFPEFKGNWDYFILGQIAKFSKGKGISKADTSVNGKFECIRYGELYTVYGETISEVVSKTDLEHKNLIFSSYNDIIIPASGETQLDIATASCVLKDGIALGGDLNIIKTDNNGVFLSYYLNNAKKEDIASLAQGVSVVHLYSSQLSTLNLNLPSVEEQTRIAKFLSSVDEKLNLLKEKQAILEEYKKGIMQKIFNQEIRFKDDNGNDFEDWEEIKLRDITTLITKGTTPKNFVSAGVNYVKIECIDGNSLNLKKCLFIEKETHTKELKRSILEENDILFAIAGSIGKSIIIKKHHLPANTNQALSIIRLHKNQILEFVFQVLNAEHIKKYIQDNISVGAQPNLNLEQVGSYAFNCPKSNLEQTKIANFLSAIDEKIELISNQIQDTQEYKKGLLQQMFV